jgi:Trypsin
MRADTTSVRLRVVLLLACLCAIALAPAQAAFAAPVNQRVTNGDDVADGRYPWQVALILGDQSALTQFCGGTLVSSTVVVTAAHCVFDMTPDDLDVAAGTHRDLAEVTAGEIYDVDTIAVHPDADVDGADTRSDLAILELATPVAGAQPIQIISPAAFSALAAGTDLKITGWGLTETGPPPPDRLQEAVVDLISDSQCASAWGSTFSSTDMMCALRVTPGMPDDTVFDTCNGDSGGPITTIPGGTPDPTNPAGWILVGAVSFGSESCLAASIPGIYTRLGAPSINSFAASAIDGDPDNDPKEKPWFRGTGRPTISPTTELDPGDRITCDRGSIDQEPDSAPVTLAIRRVSTDVAATGGPSVDYTIGSGDGNARFVCEARTFDPAAGKYGAVRTSASTDAVRSPAPPPPPSPPPPPPEPPVITTPIPVPRDVLAPRVEGFRRACTRRRRCTLTLVIADSAPSTGIRTPRVQLRTTVRRRCVRRGRRATCSRRVTRTLRARRVGTTTTFTVATGALRRGRHSVTVTVTDVAGNRRRTPFRASFSLR